MNKKVEEFLKSWDKEEKSLCDFMCDWFDDADDEFYYIDRNCSRFIGEHLNLNKITQLSIELLIIDIEEDQHED